MGFRDSSNVFRFEGFDVLEGIGLFVAKVEYAEVGIHPEGAAVIGDDIADSKADNLARGESHFGVDFREIKNDVPFGHDGL